MQKLLSIALAVLFLSSSILRADVALPGLFSDHMILQRSARTAIWGQASPGEEIKIAIGEASTTARADDDGKWKSFIDLSKVGQGPFDLVVEGKNRVAFADVLVGQVWLASGQSNMEWILKDTLDAPREIAASANPLIRLYSVPKASIPEPAGDCKGKWAVAGPETTGAFSGIGYYFAKSLQKHLGEPVGVICAAWGGSPCEAWLSEQAFDRDENLRKGAEKIWQATEEYPEKKQRFGADFSRWLKENSREDRSVGPAADFAGETVSSDGWTTVKLPGPVAGEGLPKNGAVWLRKEIDLPPQPAGVKFLLEIGEIQGFDSIYWNGRRVLDTTPANFPGLKYWRRAAIPAADLKVGRNVVAIRIFAPVAPPKLLIPPANFKAGDQSLAGPWLARAEFDLPPFDAAKSPPPEPPRTAPRTQDIASYLYNGMINPLTNMTISGVIWSQGEANANRADQYRSTFLGLIQDWRSQWGDADLPFYHCQLANFLSKSNAPGDCARAELREAQSLSLSLPHTGQVVLIDRGDAEDIHPRNKTYPGEQLSRVALAEHYKLDLPLLGPVYQSSQVEGSSIRLTFGHTDGGLVAKPLPDTYVLRSVTGTRAPLVRNSPGSPLEGFAICGPDKKWHWAVARIEGDAVIVSSPDVTAPVAVRYAWADNPTCNLYNGAGLPAGPFRTDDFPRITKGVSY